MDSILSHKKPFLAAVFITVAILLCTLVPLSASASISDSSIFVPFNGSDSYDRDVIASSLVDLYGTYFPYYIFVDPYVYNANWGYIILAQDIELHSLSYDVENDRTTFIATCSGAVRYTIMRDAVNSRWELIRASSSEYDYTAPAKLTGIYTNARQSGDIVSNPYGYGGLWYPYENALIHAYTSGSVEVTENLAVIMQQIGDNHTAIMSALGDIGSDIRGVWETLLGMRLSQLESGYYDNIKNIADLLSQVFADTSVSEDARQWAENIVEEYIDDSSALGDQIIAGSEENILSGVQAELVTDLLAFPPALLSIVVCGITCIIVVFGVKKGMS